MKPKRAAYVPLCCDSEPKPVTHGICETGVPVTDSGNESPNIGLPLLDCS
jgi:hypothetical protein